jgi:glutamate dehydrogenase
VPDDPVIAAALERYFPVPLRKRFARQIQAHPLRREIVATHVTNSMVNRVGSTFVHRMREETGAGTAEAVRAYLVTREAYALVPFWQEVEALELKVADEVQSAMLLDGGRLIVRATLWLLRNRRHLADIAAAVAYFRPGIEALAALLPDAFAEGERAGYERAVARYAQAGVPAALAAHVARFDALPAALDLVEVAEALGRDVRAVAEAYFALGGRLEFPWLRARIAELPAESHWQTLAKAALRDDLSGMQRQLAADVLRGAAGDPRAALAAWEQANRPLLERFRAMHADLRAHKTLDLAMVSVAMRELRNIAA